MLVSLMRDWSGDAFEDEEEESQELIKAILSGSFEKSLDRL